MSRLSALPVEILDAITRRLPGGCIIDLWISGSKALQFKLSAGGVSKIRLEDRRRGTTSRWPLFLPKLRHLKSLKVIKSLESLGDASFIALELQKMAPCLERLHLNFAEAEECLLRVLELDHLLEGVFDSSEETTVEEKEEQEEEEEEDLYERRTWLDDFFPHLRALKLETNRPALDWSEYNELPQTLEKLAISRGAPHTITLFASIPRHVRSLQLSQTAESIDLLWECLPPSLETLRYIKVPAEDLAKLPRSLTSLTVQQDEWSPESMDMLPEKLQHLEIYGSSGIMTPDCLTRLPKGLISWGSPGMLGISGLCDHNTLDSLPKSLIRFDHGLLIDVNLDAVESSHWPPHLELFNACCMVSQNSFFRSLPSSLTVLILPDLTPTSIAKSLERGNSLTEVERRAQEAAKAFLPSHLAQDDNLDLCASWIALFMYLSAANLHQLVRMHITQPHHAPISFPWDEESMKLPSGLKKLRLDFPLILTPSFWACLPRSLVKIRSNVEGQIFVPDRRTFEPTASPYLEGLDLAPKSLVSLRMNQLSFSIRPETMELLPRSLTRIELAGKDQSLTVQQINGLPPGLRTFLIKGASLATLAAVAALPKTLEKFAILQLDPRHYHALPPKLRQLYIFTPSDIRGEQLALLPRSITNLRLVVDTESPKPLTATDWVYLPPTLNYVDCGLAGAQYIQQRHKMKRPMPKVDPCPSNLPLTH